MKFEKVSLEQYLKDCQSDEYSISNSSHTIKDVLEGTVRFSSTFVNLREKTLNELYENIRLPMRATKKSAGYDIFAPYDFRLGPGETIRISTGIRAILDDDKFLMCAPRSGHGFKARIQLDNTIGIIDADYSESTNEGHIILKLTNDSKIHRCISVAEGDGIAQAIILQYFTVDDDNTDRRRDGGFGSTDRNYKEDK